MRGAYLFPNNKISYDQYLKTVEDMVSHGSVICSTENISVGIEALTTLDDPVRRQKMIDVSVWADRDFSESYSRNTNIFKKLPIIMSVADMMGNFYDSVKELNNEELALLGFFSFVVRHSEMEEHLKLFSDKDLLSSVISTFPTKEDRMTALGIVEDKYYEFAIDKEPESELYKFKKESIMAIRCSSNEEFLSMAKPLEEIFKELEERGIYL